MTAQDTTRAPDGFAAGARRGTRAFAFFEWMIALRYLRSRRKERFVSVISIISLAGIAIGVAVLIIVMAVMNGFRHELLSRILGIRGHVVIHGYEGPLDDYAGVVMRVQRVPGVINAAPLVEGQVLISANGLSAGVAVRGIRKADLGALATLSRTLTDGLFCPMPQGTTSTPPAEQARALANFTGNNAVIVGGRLANKMGLYPGGTLTLIAPRGNVTPFGTTPRVKTYRIAGTFCIGMTEYDQGLVLMPFEEAQLFFNLANQASDVEVMVDHPDHSIALEVPILRAAGPGTRVYTWQQLDSTFFDAIIVERNVMFLILTLIILVAALNIISGLVMLVKDKSGDIAILRTMGASRGVVMRVFLIAGTSIGVVGTILGFLIGVVFCANIETIRQFLSSLTGTTLFDPEIYFLSHMPAEMNANEVVAVVVMALSLTLLATLYPAWRASSLDPVEALRYE
jgi:lipoprotein-releasing system permease protein